MALFKKLVLFVPLFCAYTQLTAQVQDNYLNNESYRFYGGLILGMNFSQVDGDTYSGYNKVGLNTGALVYARLSDLMGMSLEFDYTQKGSHAVSNSESPALGAYFSEYKLKLNYVEVPVMLHILVNRKLHYEVGASYAQLLNFSEKLTSDPGVVIDPNVFYFRKTDICFNAGLCYHLYNSWYLEGRYQYSMATIRDAERIPIGGPRQFNNLFMFRFVRFLNKTPQS